MEMCLIHPALGISNVTVKAQGKKTGDRCASLDRFCVSAGEPRGGKTSDPQTPTNSSQAEDTLAFVLLEEDKTVLTSVVWHLPK